MPEARERAAEMFRAIAPVAEEIENKVTVGVRFVDCGANFERVLCPICGKELEMEWWNEQMDKDFDGEFKLNSVRVPCCRGEKTLNDLRYEWQQGFARFSLEVMNPNVGELTKDDVKAFETILGCPVKVIYQHI
jgi:hypothetical protein